jgi:ABC-type transport system involved in cytochrome c biogenesis permease subunit
MSHLGRLAPWIILVIAGLYLAVAMSPMEAPAKTMLFSEAGKIPIQHGGRIKPLDTLARVSLLIISERQYYRDADDNKRPAIQWLLDVMTSGLKPSNASAKRKAFRIEDPEFVKLLGLPEREGNLYAYEEFEPQVGSFLAAAQERIQRVGFEQLSASDKKLLDLAIQIDAYEKHARFETLDKVFRIDNIELQNLLGLERREGFRYSYDEFVPRIGQLIRERQRIEQTPEKSRTVYESKVEEFAKRVDLYVGLARLEGATLRIIPPAKPGDPWRAIGEAFQEERSSGAQSPGALHGFAEILRTYSKGDADGFNKAVGDYRKLVDTTLPGDAGRAQFEAFYNHFEPFYQCTLLYVGIFLLACFSWMGWSRPLARSAFWLCVLTLGLHTLAIFARIVLQGRPPVTNLYSSAIFVGWGCVGLGLFLELIYPRGIAVAASGVLGFLTALLAHHLAESGDTMEMLQAVLDTNFWLATHVTAVTIGYAATLLAGVLGVLYIAFGLVAPPGSSDVLKVVNTMIYGIVCFATLFSFTGTILGGIWADYSWGRFWGWDPKENGALIIVIWNALLLHARWGGIVKQRGLAVLSVVGIIVTIWSWIGTNQLGVGLHAYGFNDKLRLIAVYTWGASLAVVLIGLVPLRYWRALQPSPVMSGRRNRG